MINFDMNAGFYKEGQFKYNLNGFSYLQLDMQQQLFQKYQNMKQMFHAGHVIYVNGATDALRLVFTQVPDIFLYPNQHKRTEKFKNPAIPSNENGVCLINYYQGQEEQLEEAKKKFQYVILDFSQGIGKLDIPNDYDALLFSCSKVNGPFQTGFLITHENSDVWEKVLCPFNLREEEQPDFKYVGSLNVDMCLQAFESVLNLTMLDLSKALEKKKKIIQFLENQENHVELVSSTQNHVILFKLKHNWCPRSFQNIMFQNGVLIGFVSACQARETMILRLSFDEEDNVDKFISAFKESIIQMVEAGDNVKIVNEDDGRQPEASAVGEIRGGAKAADDTQGLRKEDMKKIIDMSDYKTFFEQINQNNYFLNAHWAPSHDAEPHISEKYAIMFQPELFVSKYTVSLNIPPHHELHNLEEKIQKQKENEDDNYDFEHDVIRIQKRRLAKNLWMNNPDCDYQLSLENFKTEKIKILLSDQVFRSVFNNTLLKKSYPKNFEEEVKEYEIEIKKYPEDLPQNIYVEYNKGEDKEHSDEDLDEKQSDEEQSDEEESEQSEDSEDSKDKNKKGGAELLRSKTGGRKDPDHIRSKINFYATSFNLKLLTKLGGNCLSVSILHNLNRIYKRGEKPSKLYNPHQLIVLDQQAYSYLTYFGMPLSSLNLQYFLKDQRSQYDKGELVKPYFYSEFSGIKYCAEEVKKKQNIYYCNTVNIQYDFLKEFLKEHDTGDVVLYLQYINEDEITQPFGLQHWFIENGFKYEILEKSCYDVWDMKYLDPIPIVKMYK